MVDTVLADTGAEAAASGVEAGGGVAEAAGSVAGDAVSGLDLDDGWLVVVVLGIIAALVFGGRDLLDLRSAGHSVRGGLRGYPRRGAGARGAANGGRRLDGERLQGDLDTLTLTLVLSLLAGYLIHHFFPGVTRLSELWAHL